MMSSGFYSQNGRWPDPYSVLFREAHYYSEYIAVYSVSILPFIPLLGSARLVWRNMEEISPTSFSPTLLADMWMMSSGFYSQNGRWPDPKSSRQKGGAGYFPNYSIFYILLVCCC